MPPSHHNDTNPKLNGPSPTRSASCSTCKVDTEAARQHISGILPSPLPDASLAGHIQDCLHVLVHTWSNTSLAIEQLLERSIEFQAESSAHGQKTTKREPGKAAQSEGPCCEQHADQLSRILWRWLLVFEFQLLTFAGTRTIIPQGRMRPAARFTTS